MASARAAIAASVNKRRAMQRDTSLARALEATAVAVARQPVQDDEALALAFRAMQVVANSSTGAQAVEASARTAAWAPAIEVLARRQQDLDRQGQRRRPQVERPARQGHRRRDRRGRARTLGKPVARRSMWRCARDERGFPRYGDLANQSIAPLADLQGHRRRLAAGRGAGAADADQGRALRDGGHAPQGVAAHARARF